MANTQTIRCINKHDRDDPFDRIKHVGGLNADGTRWKLTQKQAIEYIESGSWAFYVERGSSIVKVVVATSAHGNKYLKTEADGQDANNLLRVRFETL